jgi:hypothetical protein
MGIIDRFFPKTLKPEEINTQGITKTRAPSNAEIMVAVVEDGEDTKTTRMPSPLEREKTFPARPNNMDSEPSLEKLPEASPDSAAADSTVRDAAFILSRPEVYVIRRTLRHAVKFEPALAAYFFRKAQKHEIPEARIKAIIELFGF